MPKKLVGPYITEEEYNVNGNSGTSLYLNVPVTGGFVARQKLSKAGLEKGLDESVKEALKVCKAEEIK